MTDLTDRTVAALADVRAPDAWDAAHAEACCRVYARDEGELGLFLEALGLGP